MYDALVEALISGETSFPCAQFKEGYERLLDIDPETGMTKILLQYNVSKSLNLLS